MSIHVIRPQPEEPYVQCPVVGGGETAESARHEVLMLWPHDGKYEDVRMRVFPPEGRVFELRFDATAMREALLEVARLSDEKRTRQASP